MENNNPYQISLLTRLASLCVRSIKSRERHFSAAEKFKTKKNILSILLISISSFTTAGVLSILSDEALKNIVNNNEVFLQINFYSKVFSAFFAAVSTTITVVLILLNLDEKIIKHERAGHNYSTLRDDVILLAENIKFFFEKTNVYDVQRLEKEADSLAISSPTIPKDIHKKEKKREDENERKQKDKFKVSISYWLHRFIDIENCPEIKEVLQNINENKK